MIDYSFYSNENKMNNICEVCAETFEEGHVCRKCRYGFKALSVDDDKFGKCLNCQDCDKYWFPCSTCAKEAFYYNLGKGNDQNEKGLSFDELIHILGDKEQIHEIRSKESNEKGYCLIQ